MNLPRMSLRAQVQRVRQHHPHTDLDVVLDDSIANVVEQRLDLTLRGGQLTDKDLHAMRFARCHVAQFPVRGEDRGAGSA